MSRKKDSIKRNPKTADREKAFTHNFAQYAQSKNHWDAAACNAESRLVPPRRNGCRSSFV